MSHARRVPHKPSGLLQATSPAQQVLASRVTEWLCAACRSGVHSVDACRYDCEMAETMSRSAVTGCLEVFRVSGIKGSVPFVNHRLGKAASRGSDFVSIYVGLCHETSIMCRGERGSRFCEVRVKEYCDSSRPQ